MARGRNNRSGASSKPKNDKFTGVPSPGNTRSTRSMEDHLATIDHHWNSLTPKSKAFLLEHKSIATLTWDSLMKFWSQPDQIHYAQMAVSVGTCHLLAYEYFHIKAYANAAILALNGAFLQQCMNKKSISDLKTWPSEKITKENLPHFHTAQEFLSKSPECISRYLSKVLPLRYQNMLQLEGHVSHVPGMGYVDLISNDWNTTSHGSSGKQHRLDGNPDEEEIKIILSNEDKGSKYEMNVKPSMALKSVFNAYADECGESLRSLRFSYNGKTLFLSSLGQKSVSDLGMQDSEVILIYSNSTPKVEEPSQPSLQQKKSKKKDKPTTKKVHQAKSKPKASPQPILIPKTEKELQEAHSLLLSKVFEEAEPQLKLIRQKLNELLLDCQGPKDRRGSSKKNITTEKTTIFNPNNCGLGGKAGRTSFAINVGQIENLHISFKRNSIHSRASISTRSSVIDLHGCNRDEAIERLDSSLISWMDDAMRGEYPWVIPATIICGAGNQILSETVEGWIKGNNNVANAPRGSLLYQ